ncbi:hypothetical protein [Streptomyces axinellae]
MTSTSLPSTFKEAAPEDPARAGESLVLAATRGGRALIAVLLPGTGAERAAK